MTKLTNLPYDMSYVVSWQTYLGPLRCRFAQRKPLIWLLPGLHYVAGNCMFRLPLGKDGKPRLNCSWTTLLQNAHGIAFSVNYEQAWPPVCRSSDQMIIRNGNHWAMRGYDYGFNDLSQLQFPMWVRLSLFQSTGFLTDSFNTFMWIP